MAIDVLLNSEEYPFSSKRQGTASQVKPVGGFLLTALEHEGDGGSWDGCFGLCSELHIKTEGLLKPGRGEPQGR